MFVIEVDTATEVRGPLHGELANVVSDAINAHTPGYACKVRVSWQDKPLRCPLCHSEAYICTADHTGDPGPRIHCRAASLHNFSLVPTALATKEA